MPHSTRGTTSGLGRGVIAVRGTSPVLEEGTNAMLGVSSGPGRRVNAVPGNLPGSGMGTNTLCGACFEPE